jgi:hypothetical protein
LQYSTREGWALRQEGCGITLIACRSSSAEGEQARRFKEAEDVELFEAAEEEEAVGFRLRSRGLGEEGQSAAREPARYPKLITEALASIMKRFILQLLRGLSMMMHYLFSCL